MIGYIVSILISAGIFALLCQGLNVHWGFTGLLNFGIVAFFGVGAYTYAIAVVHFGTPLFLALLLAALFSGVFGALVALPAIRLRSDYLAVVTLAIGEITRHVLKSAPGLTDYTGGAAGIRGFSSGFYALRETLNLDFLSRSQFLLLFVWLTLMVVSIFLKLALKSPWGRILESIREDEDAMRALGKNVTRYKAQSFAVGSAVAGLAGALFALNLSSLSPDAFQPDISFYAWIILLIGGAGSLYGPVLGSIVFWVLFNLTQFLTGDFLTAAESAFFRLILLGAGIMLLVMFRPQGILGREVTTRGL